MKTKATSLTSSPGALSVLAVVALGMFIHVSPALACGDYKSFALFNLAQQAVSPDRQSADAAITALRAEGRRGLDALFAIHNPEIVQHLTNGVGNPNWERLRLALERVSGQRDCAEARLFWHTDLDLARTEAAATGKPILSLRLLGRLDEELSCANSRYFRTALYANQEVSRLLREHFVLHWESVRPVPRITIDFGDGRKLERTITGNSAHYVLDAEGRPLDALPGLHGPKAFMSWLTRMDALNRQLAAAAADHRGTILTTYHAERAAALEKEWQADLQRAGLEASKDLSDGDWLKLAALHQEDARLDASSRRLVARKHPDAVAAGNRAISKAIVESPVLKAMRLFEQSIAQDTVRNEYLLHRTIHSWYLAVQPPVSINPLNDRVYTELFLTPRSDPWLGLKPEGAYSALEGDGVVVAGKR